MFPVYWQWQWFIKKWQFGQCPTFINNRDVLKRRNFMCYNDMLRISLLKTLALMPTSVMNSINFVNCPCFLSTTRCAMYLNKFIVFILYFRHGSVQNLHVKIHDRNRILSSSDKCEVIKIYRNLYIIYVSQCIFSPAWFPVRT